MNKGEDITLNRRILEDRLADYRMRDPAEIRAELVAKWRAAYPLAAGEQPSETLKPLMRWEAWTGPVKPEDPDEIWYNDIYHITVRRHKKDAVFGTDGGMIQLGINTHEGIARHDWREFQSIKNQLAGPECEAFELYPAESRLCDPSNYYTLWCFPGVKRLKVGLMERRVLDADISLSPQRRLPPETHP